MITIMNKKISLRKARKILKHACQCYDQMSEQLSPNVRTTFEDKLEKLDEAVKIKDDNAIQTTAPWVETFTKEHFRKSAFTHAKELIAALLFAVIVAICVRQMWFELYQIPSGSMRPTYQEQDHLSVSKTEFGINIPLMAGHFYFDADKVKRTGTIIFMGDNLPLEDASSWYWSRRYIKRLIAKPGDTLYFYGGKIYGLDQNGKPIEELLNAESMQALEHIPFLSFIGRPEQLSSNIVQIRQMNLPVGKVHLSQWERQGEVFDGKNWVPDNPEALKKPHDTVQTYGDLWGIHNYAMARLLTPAQVKQNPQLAKLNLDPAPLYLEINHTPSFARINEPLKTAIPLSKEKIDRLMDSMYTTRFDVKNEQSIAYRADAGVPRANQVRLPGVPDGRYQFDHGRAEQVGFSAILSPLPKDHPLNNRGIDFVQTLYNNGLEWYKDSANLPNRYVYYRDGDLFVLGAPLFNKDDPELKEFVERELAREKNNKAYVAFIDRGAPDKNTIEKFGLKVPEGSYVVLGDNHAISGDSRIMGFIPEANLQGVPDLLLWPAGSRWPYPEASTPYSMITGPRVFVWIVASLIGIGIFVYYRKQRSKGYFKRKKRD